LFDEDRRSVDFTVWEDDVATLVNRRGRRPRQVETEMLSPYSYQLNRFQTRQFSEGRHRNSIDTMIALLRGFDPEIESVEIQSLRGGRPSLYVHHRRLGFAPLSVFGDAMRRAFLLATTVMTFEGGGVLFIDEIETGIHVHALQRVFSWLARVANERNVQVIATTHSLEAVDAILFGAPDGMRDDIVAFHLEQTEERTIAKRFDGDLLARLRKERGLDVR
jgi:AAA15 family ATPase/GTPase